MDPGGANLEPRASAYTTLHLPLPWELRAGSFLSLTFIHLRSGETKAPKKGRGGVPATGLPRQRGAGTRGCGLAFSGSGIGARRPVLLPAMLLPRCVS